MQWVPPACLIGIQEEPNAKEAYIRYQREVLSRIVTVEDVGLCVPNWNRSIGASPDGIVCCSGELPMVLEIKCLSDKSPLPRTIVEIARDRGGGFYCSVDSEGVLSLKRNHQYYYQVLGEMATTGLHRADFVIYHPRTGELSVERIDFDTAEWGRVEQRLGEFTHKYLKAGSDQCSVRVHSSASSVV